MTSTRIGSRIRLQPYAAALLSACLVTLETEAQSPPDVLQDLNTESNPCGSNPSWSTETKSYIVDVALDDQGNDLHVIDPKTRKIVRRIDTGPNTPENPTWVGSDNTIVCRILAPQKGWELGVVDLDTGNVKLIDIRPGNFSSNPSSLVRSGTSVYFGADDGQVGLELWVSDGTVAGTKLLHDIRPGPAGSGIEDIEDFGNELAFSADNGADGEEWMLYELQTGMLQVYDLASGPASSFPCCFAQLNNGTDYCLAETDSSNAHQELWFVENGNMTEVKLSSTPTSEIVPYNGSAYWLDGASLCQANPSSPQPKKAVTASAVWDLTCTSKHLVFTFDPGNFDPALGFWNGNQLTRIDLPGNAMPQKLAGDASRDTVWFSYPTSNFGWEPWSSDGTLAGTDMVEDIAPGFLSSQPRSFRFHLLHALVHFGADDGENGLEPYLCDPITNTCDLIEICPDPTDDANPEDCTAFSAGVSFGADNGTNGIEPYLFVDPVSGGAGFKQFDLNRGSNGSHPKEFLQLGHKMFVIAHGTHPTTSSATGIEVWVFDLITYKVDVLDINPGTKGSNPAELTAWRGKVYFAADGGSGHELWESDGTQAGTKMVAELLAGPASSYPAYFTPFQGRLWFTANGDLHRSAPSGTEIWSTDGTAAGTRLELEMWPGAVGSTPRFLTVLDDKLLFQSIAPDPRTGRSLGRELHISDGTQAGTVVVDLSTVAPGADPLPGGESLPRSARYAVAGGLAYFLATVGPHGKELCRTDGTKNGTVMVKDIRPGSLDSTPSYLTPLGDGIVFAANDGASGVELWSSIGTSAGTQRVADINTSGSSAIQEITRLGSRRVVFQAADSTGDVELYESDGTQAGTRRVADLNPAGSSSPGEFAESRGQLIFAATSNVVGRELFRWKPGGTATPVPLTCKADEAPRLDATDPVLGSQMQLSVQTTLQDKRGAILFGLPFDMTVPFPGGCELYVNPAALMPFRVNAQGHWTSSLTVPNVAALSGGLLSAQAGFGPAATGNQFLLSNGLDLVPGK